MVPIEGIDKRAPLTIISWNFTFKYLFLFCTRCSIKSVTENHVTLLPTPSGVSFFFEKGKFNHFYEFNNFQQSPGALDKIFWRSSSLQMCTDLMQLNALNETVLDGIYLKFYSDHSINTYRGLFCSNWLFAVLNKHNIIVYPWMVKLEYKLMLVLKTKYRPDISTE